MKTEHKTLDYSDYGIFGEKSVKEISPMKKKIWDPKWIEVI